MNKYVVAIVIEFKANDDDNAREFVDGICNESNADFEWVDTLVNESEKIMLPTLGVQP